MNVNITTYAAARPRDLKTFIKEMWQHRHNPVLGFSIEEAKLISSHTLAGRARRLILRLFRRRKPSTESCTNVSIEHMVKTAPPPPDFESEEAEKAANRFLALNKKFHAVPIKKASRPKFRRLPRTELVRQAKAYIKPLGRGTRLVAVSQVNEITMKVAFTPPNSKKVEWQHAAILLR